MTVLSAQNDRTTLWWLALAWLMVILALPTTALMDVSKTYMDIAEKITGKTLTLSDNPAAEVISILHDQYQLID